MWVFGRCLISDPDPYPGYPTHVPTWVCKPMTCTTTMEGFHHCHHLTPHARWRGSATITTPPPPLPCFKREMEGLDACFQGSDYPLPANTISPTPSLLETPLFHPSLPLPHSKHEGGKAEGAVSLPPPLGSLRPHSKCKTRRLFLFSPPLPSLA